MQQLHPGVLLSEVGTPVRRLFLLCHMSMWCVWSSAKRLLRLRGPKTPQRGSLNPRLLAALLTQTCSYVNESTQRVGQVQHALSSLVQEHCVHASPFQGLQSV